jgi:hypothetical protein
MSKYLLIKTSILSVILMGYNVKINFLIKFNIKPVRPTLKRISYMHAKLTQKPLSQTGIVRAARCALCKFFIVGELIRQSNKTQK